MNVWPSKGETKCSMKYRVGKQNHLLGLLLNMAQKGPRISNNFTTYMCHEWQKQSHQVAEAVHWPCPAGITDLRWTAKSPWRILSCHSSSGSHRWTRAVRKEPLQGGITSTYLFNLIHAQPVSVGWTWNAASISVSLHLEGWHGHGALKVGSSMA